MSHPQIGQTIAVFDKSGKVVSTSKHLLNIFREAKDAYREKKAEINAQRKAELEAKRARRALENFTFDERASAAPSKVSSRRTHRTRRSRARHHEPVYQYDDEYYAEDMRRQTAPTIRRYEQDYDMPAPRMEIIRRHTTNDAQIAHRPLPTRSATVAGPAIDMDLAYGEIPPPLPPRHEDEDELKGLLSKLNLALDEAHCVRHTVTTMVSSLQKNPDAMAAVALTLAEISKLAAKVSPQVLTALKGSFPAIFALMASPQFMIAVGVGVGVTVVMLGGYKIVQKIQQRKVVDAPMPVAEEVQPEFDQLEEMDVDLSGIETWRRGIADAEADSVAISVDGEFLTPEAASILREERQRDRTGQSEASRRTKSTKHTKHRKSEKGDKEKKKKKHSSLRLLFHA
ncbi:hypothetical protein L228DRAFT_243106 [Xylona heveae TC161]|uniref:Uncharacterized protein n=1 Tax=Xylona heveae (strain CBS 132557 / TC161) TaxID=1328760 RepID=A0A165JTR8_XYLHT|nr:hypothetical protein L228DRAFT_243106 [Xylona heveae TC161]KZF26616.1 hypothetical protein L228DRAFT_243106 [Xylona heveae TC161]